MEIDELRKTLAARGYTEAEIAERLKPIEAITLSRARLAKRHRLTVMTDVVIGETRDFLKEALGILPSREQVLEVIPPGSETYAIMCEYGVAGDTATRSEVADCFSQRLMGRAIPTYGDSLSDEQRRRFYSDLAKAAQSAGIPVIGTPATHEPTPHNN